MLVLSGADLMDGTPVFDIKPYVPYADCHPEATGGFTEQAGDFLLRCPFPPPIGSNSCVPAGGPFGVLAHDPRPSYQHDPERIYGLSFGGYNVRFRVDGKLLTVCQLEPFPASP